MPLLLAFTGRFTPHRRVAVPRTAGDLNPSGVEGPVPGGVDALRALKLSLIAGTVFFIGTVYWTGTVIIEFGDVPRVVAAVGVVLMSMYLATYHVIGLLVTSRVIARLGARGLFFAPIGWVGGEFLRGVLLGGFPWLPLGNSQVDVLPVAQLASLLGVYGLSALVAYINATAAFALLRSGRSRLVAIATAAVVLFGIAGWGTLRIRDGSLMRQGTPIRVGIIQPNIEQSAKLAADSDARQARRIFTTNIAMTRDVVKRGAQFVIWPESSIPFKFERDPRGEDIRSLAREVQVPILFGSDQQTGMFEKTAIYNAAYEVRPDGRTAAVYRKIHLVPFGEFVPLRKWLFFLRPLVDSFLDFSAGDAMVMLPIGSHQASTAICYEVVYPSLVREAVNMGSELLTTITNDGWYGHSSAPYQHFEMAKMRSIEEGRYLVRAANTGISGVVDPYGREVRRSAIFEEVGLVEEVRFLTGRTIYARIGDVVGYVSLALVLLTPLVLWRGRV
ncbi:MAG TPA: apolipoprotein N-acyltransferase [Vicinamibacterales bacterium]|nr:apolipoprotein N-acyltransferase [Vicinamibacterales bacterium]